MAKIPRYEQKEQWNPLAAPVVPMSLADTGMPEAFSSIAQSAFGVAEKERKAQDKLDYDNFKTDYTRDLEKAKVGSLSKKPSERAEYVRNEANTIKSDWLNNYSDGKTSMDAWNLMNSYADYQSMLVVSKTKYDARIALSDALQAGSNARFDDITKDVAITDILPKETLASHRLEVDTSVDSILNVIMDDTSWESHIANKLSAHALVHHGRVFTLGIQGKLTRDPILPDASSIQNALVGTLDIEQRIKKTYPHMPEAKREELVNFYEDILTTTAGGVKSKEEVLAKFNKDITAHESSQRTKASLEAHARYTDAAVDLMRDMQRAKTGQPHRAIGPHRLIPFAVLTKDLPNTGARKMAFVQKLLEEYNEGSRKPTESELGYYEQVLTHIRTELRDAAPHEVMKYIQETVYPDVERAKGNNGKFRIPTDLYLDLLDESGKFGGRVATGGAGAGWFVAKQGMGLPDMDVLGFKEPLMGVLRNELRYKFGDNPKDNLKSASDASLFAGMEAYIEKLLSEQAYAEKKMTRMEMEDRVRGMVKGKEIGEFSDRWKTGAVLTVPIVQVDRLLDMHFSKEPMTDSQKHIVDLYSHRMINRLSNLSLDGQLKGLISTGLVQKLMRKKEAIAAGGKNARDMYSYSVVQELKKQVTLHPYDLEFIKALSKKGENSLRSKLVRYQNEKFEAFDVTKTQGVRTRPEPGKTAGKVELKPKKPGMLQPSPPSGKEISANENKIEGKGIYNRVTQMAFEKYQKLSFPGSKKPGGNWMHESISEMMGGIPYDEIYKDYIGMSDKEFQKKYGEY